MIRRPAFFWIWMKVSAVNTKTLRILKGLKGHYPHALEQQFPRVFDKIMAMWDKPEIEAYFIELMVSNRASRQGFPKKVASDIVCLSMLHAQQQKPVLAGNPWHEADIFIEPSAQAPSVAVSRKDLIKAVETGDLKVVERILSAGFDVEVCDERQWTPLMIAAYNGNEKMALLLINSGGNVHHADNAGYTCLHWAAFNGHVEMAGLLLGKGAEVNARSLHGWTALLQAATRGHSAVTSILLDAGADINRASDDGWTALHKASANGREQEVVLLLGRGADVMAKCKDGALPIDLARKNKHEQIVALLMPKS